MITNTHPLRLFAIILLCGVIFYSACDTSLTDSNDSGEPNGPDHVKEIVHMIPEVLGQIPHDSTAYTQGLVFRDSLLFESTGLYGRSGVRRLDPATGDVLYMISLPDSVFGEGLASTETALVQLTWREGLAYYYDPESLGLMKVHTYSGQGWGLCYDGEYLFMTYGGDHLVRRDPDTFSILDSVRITRNGTPLPYVNDIDCVGDYIWGNVYRSPNIVQIDKKTGRVVGIVDASGIFPESVDPDNIHQVLNGIAYREETGTFFLTGKQWPVMYEVLFVEQLVEQPAR